jgi:hypothetical protein
VNASSPVKRLWLGLREAAFLNGERVRLWAAVFAATWSCLLAVDFALHMTHGVLDARGAHLGRDFINYWAGARLALQGRAGLAYDFYGFWDFQKSLVGAASEQKLYSYPPVCLLLTLPLALLPYVPAFVLWSGLGLWGFVRLLSRNVDLRLAVLATLAAPATYWCLLDGQNGMFTAILFALGIAWMERRPAAAGAVFGLLSYKPHLWVLLPLALAAGRQWRCFVAAAAAVLALLGLSVLVCGVEAWSGFLGRMSFQRALIEEHIWYQVPTVFCMLREFSLPITLAYGVQAVSALAAGVIVADVWRRPAPVEVKGAALVFASPLATPYAFCYDLPMTLFAIAWLAADARRTGFLPWEKCAWLLVVILPVTMSFIAQAMGFQAVPVALWFALVLAQRRAALASA